MENYNLNEDEVVLYKGEVNLLNNKGNAKLVLTNLNLVIVILNRVQSAEVDIFPLEDVKFYEGVPQVKTKSNNVEIYFKHAEKEFSFNSKIELHKFVSAITKVLTGKTAMQRGAVKVHSVIDCVNEALGVDIVKTTQEILVEGVVNGVVNNVTDMLGKAGKMGMTLITKKKK